ncbi:MAG: hypothetical protein ACLGH8_10055 [Bacteroidia bacterium]
MNEEKKHDELDNLFASLNGQWDTEEPALGHHKRFMERQEVKEEPAKRSILRIIMPVAAAIIMVLGLAFIFLNRPADDALASNRMSAKNREAQEYFSMVIKKELAKVEKENTPETRKLVTDALKQMDVLEKDYNKLAHELEAKGESKKIIHAMITNLQTRISFLEDVLTQIENIKKIKEDYHENNA